MKQFGQLVKEMIPVLLGVLIALLLSNWNDTRKEKAYLNQIYSSIKSELEDSATDLQRVIPKQLATVDTINHYLNNEEYTLYDILIKGGGIQLPSIKTNSWNALSNSRIELIEYKNLTSLADIEEWKENLGNRTEKQMDFILSNLEETDKWKKEIFKMTILDIVGSEKGLLSNIENLMKEEPYHSIKSQNQDFKNTKGNQMLEN